jgi:ABC-type multidrug transport system fused ATPase/permease subunit
MTIISVLLGFVLVTLAVAFNVGAQATLPYAISLAVLAVAIGFLVKTQPGKATAAKWTALLVLFVVSVVVMLFFNASRFVSEEMSPSSEGNVKSKEIEALTRYPQPGWIAATHKIAMSGSTEALRKRLKGSILSSFRSLSARAELSDSELALTQQIFASLYGPMDKGAAGLSCQVVTGRILVATTNPADAYNNLMRFPVTVPDCPGRLQFLMSATFACADDQSRWSKLCANDLPKDKLSSLAGHPEMGPLIKELLAKSK